MNGGNNMKEHIGSSFVVNQSYPSFELQSGDSVLVQSYDQDECLYALLILPDKTKWLKISLDELLFLKNSK